MQQEEKTGRGSLEDLHPQPNPAEYDEKLDEINSQFSKVSSIGMH